MGVTTGSLSVSSRHHRPVFKDGYTRRISEYNLSRNLAKYGLKISGIMRKRDDFFHINITTDDIRKPEDVAIAKLKEWGVR